MPVEEQLVNNQDIAMKGTNAPTCGQRLTISDREVTKLAFLLFKSGNPTGDVTFTVRKVSDKSLIMSKVWGVAGDVPASATWLEVTFDTPTTINEEVRILVEHSGYNDANFLVFRCQTTDVKADEMWTRGSVGAPVDMAAWDGAYKYTYGEAAAETAYNTKVGSPTSWLWEKCDYGSAEKCPVGSEPSWAWQAPTSEGPNKTPQGGPPSFIWGSE